MNMFICVSMFMHVCNVYVCMHVYLFVCVHVCIKQFIYSVFSKDTLDEKGQARDTRVHVTL